MAFIIDSHGRVCDGWDRRDDSKWVDPRRRDTKETHPYSYSEFFIFGSREASAAALGASYSDRLEQHDRAIWYDRPDAAPLEAA